MRSGLIGVASSSKLASLFGRLGAWGKQLPNATKASRKKYDDGIVNYLDCILVQSVGAIVVSLPQEAISRKHIKIFVNPETFNDLCVLRWVETW